ncbi:heterokaryon incompatibility protein-domain-containing protein [Aspergillus sergii]|uniref:Heterokaryon incompatibility protein-domain-containing protein n=1 Tax=Aspergillus sergii TaxID=1034303 RepID=A0A5N6XHJ7_9EURO|nr:heterokaryon incompatibility protein-domain-containing protein [Aspergillus sergii]
MTLCELCRSIPLEDLPAFPKLDGFVTFKGRHAVMGLASDGDILGFHHYSNLDGLRRASAVECELCHILVTQMNEAIVDIGKEMMLSHPRFGLRLTRRPNGGDGFVVLTPCHMQDTKCGVLVVAVMVYCCEEDDPLSTVFRARLVKDTLDTATCHRFAGWVAECNNQHSSCVIPPMPLPTRLIDVGSEASGNLVKLVEMGGEIRGHYVTLSYCWGGDSSFATTRSNVASRKEGICLHDLPQTFHDAILMTRALHIRYLWIDRLCIYQDDSQDWEKESANMGSIYANAYLCLSATGATNSTEGLIPYRKARPSVRLPHTRNDCRGHVEACLLPTLSEIYKQNSLLLNEEPLSNRAWAFQERLLSRRSLLFASDKVYFVCETEFISEDGIELVDVPNGSTARYPYKLITSGGRHSSVTPEIVRGHWRDLVSLYSRRSLTFPSDKLPAISGIAKEYGKAIGGDYVAGLWRDFLVDELTWQPIEHCRAVREYRAPSWSWASVDGFVGRFSKQVEPIASVLDFKVDVDGDNPYGRVRSGWIKIEAPLLPLVRSDYKGLAPTGSIHLKTVDGADEGFWVHFDTDSGEMIDIMRLSSLIINVHTNLLGQTLYFSLVVTPAGNEPETWRRVGWHTGRQFEFGPPHILTNRSIITLI